MKETEPEQMKVYLIVRESIHQNNNKAKEIMKDYIIMINKVNYRGTKTKTKARRKQRRIIEHISNNTYT